MQDGRFITIGELSDPEIAKGLESVIESGETTFQTIWSHSLLRKMRLHAIKDRYPAKFEVCKNMLARDPECKFPRGIDRLIEAKWNNVKVDVVDCESQKPGGVYA